MPTVPIYYDWEIPDSHRNIFIVLVDLTGKLISNIFSGVKLDFRFHKKLEQMTLMEWWLLNKNCDSIMIFIVLEKFSLRNFWGKLIHCIMKNKRNLFWIWLFSDRRRQMFTTYRPFLIQGSSCVTFFNLLITTNFAG